MLCVVPFLSAFRGMAGVGTGFSTSYAWPSCILRTVTKSVGCGNRERGSACREQKKGIAEVNAAKE